MNKYKAITAIGSSKLRTDQYSFKAENISPASANYDIDPILSIDHFQIRSPKFPPHPHAGFSAVTYLFSDSEGEFISRDSKGGFHTIQPGGIVWNVAGSGIIHEEYPKISGEKAHGLQMFINLKASDKKKEPYVLSLDGPQIPVYTADGASVRVISGSSNGIHAKINPPGEITYLDIKLDAGSDFITELPDENAALLYIIDGTAIVDGQTLHSSNTASLGSAGTKIKISASQQTHLVLIAGRPLGEAVVSHGPFTMNTREEIQSAYERYNAGEMGVLITQNDY